MKQQIQLYSYEDVLLNESAVIEKIGLFLDIDPNKFSTSRLQLIDSSFRSRPSLNRWQKELNYVEKFLFKILIGKKMKKYGYP